MKGLGYSTFKRILQFSAILFSVVVYSQTLSSQVDKNRYAIGEIGRMKIVINGLKGKTVSTAPKNELLPFHFEEISDSIFVDGDQYERVIDFAVYQEGKFNIPALDFKVGDKLLQTIPYEIEVVNTPKIDDEIADIMNNKEVTLNWRDYWELYKNYVYVALAAIALAILIFFLLKNRRKKEESSEVMTNQALKALDALEKKKYHEKGDFRSFYVELIEITRGFITQQYRIPADVLLTDDLIGLMKKTNRISADNEKIIEDVILRGDLVKFAKTFPDQKMMESDLENIRTVIKNSADDLELENLRSGV